MLNFAYECLEKSSRYSLCKTYVFRRSEKPHLGAIFLVLQIDADFKSAQKIAEITSEILEQEYFRRNQGVAKNFEFALSQTNKALSALAEAGRVEWIGKLHAQAAVVYDNQIEFAFCGKAKTMLLRDDKIINIAEDLGLSLKPHQLPLKTFANIISGNLLPGDKLIFLTPRVLDYFSMEKIKSVILTSPPDLAKKRLQIDFEQEEFEPMALLFMEMRKKEVTPVFLEKKAAAPSFVHQKESPALHPLIRHKAKKRFSLNFWDIKSAIAANLKKISHTLGSSFKPKGGFKEEKKPASVSFQMPREESTLLLSFKIILKKIASFLSKKLARLTPLSRTLLFVFLIFLVALVVSISKGASRKNKNEKTARYESIFQEASTKEKSASDALLYNDYKKARDLLTEAKKMIEGDLLAQKNYKDKGNNLLSKIQEDFDKLDKVVRVKELIAFDLEKANLHDLENLDILGAKSDIFTFHPKENTIFKLDEKAKEVIKIKNRQADLEEFVFSAINETKNSILFLTKKPDIFEFDINAREFKDLDIAFGANDFPAEMKVYVDRLYFLYPKSNQIYRHVRTVTGYSKGEEWFSNTKDLDIKNAVSFALDGAIYILKSDGQILKFLNAERQDFSVPVMTVPLSSPTRIFTEIDYKYLYVLEPKEKRVLVIDKKGGLINQYVSEEFSDLRGIYVNEKDKKMYLLTPKRLLEITLEK